MPPRLPPWRLRCPDALKQTLLWAALALIPNLLWEVGQLPLYTLANEQNGARVAYAVGHCTLGDMSIAAVSFALTRAMLGDAYWPLRRPWQGGAIVTGLGLAYTVFSEWYNVYHVGSWAYSPRMPLIAGIGLSPLLQWLLLPVVPLMVMRLAQHPPWSVETRQQGIHGTENRKGTRR
jgi:hypothetical protein